MSDGEVPEGRCGFVLEPEDLSNHAQHIQLLTNSKVKEIRAFQGGSDEWYKEAGAACCWRRTRDDSSANRCIWHAETGEKTAGEIIDARAESAEWLDGAYIPDVDLTKSIDFEKCRLWGATFDGTRLTEVSFEEVEGMAAEFIGTILRLAQFPDANLQYAQFPDTNLFQARFRGAFLSAARFPDTDLQGAIFPNAVLQEAYFTNAVLYGSQFSSAYLRDIQFHDSDLRTAQLHGVNLMGADLNDARVTDALLCRAVLEDATFTDVDLADADLTDTRLHDAHLRDIRINARTKIDGVAPEEADADWFAATNLSPLDRLRWWWTWWRADPDTLDDHRDQLDRAHTVYRTIQRLYRENSMPEEIDEYHVRAKDVRRKQAIIDSDWLRWLYLAGQRWVMRYGERPRRVVYTSLGVIGVSALLYPLVGGINRPPSPDGTTRVAFDAVPLVPFGVPEPVATVLTSLYFSVVTFTTLGYGDLQPATGVAQAVATVESLVGALLMALLVYVLGRRATR